MPQTREQETGISEMMPMQNITAKRAGVAVATAAAALSMLLLAGCRQDMQNQPKMVPQRGSSFFADGRSVRPQVEETVARGQLDEGSYFFTGMQGGVEGNTFPLPVNDALMRRGQEKYNLYCTPCHSRVGNGQGMIVERGYRPAGNFHTDRLRNAPLGHFFYVMTNGYGAMPNYAAQVSPADRWAIVAYIRALQLSQNGTEADVASGQNVQPMADIEKNSGFDSAGFYADWPMPATENVVGTPDGQDNGIPGMTGSATGKPAASSAAKTGSKPASPSAPAGVSYGSTSKQ
jgi:mono/diheme cytochrome c family protein